MNENGTTVKLQAPKRRVWEVDAIRGICILLVVFDHLMCDFIMLADWSTNFYSLRDSVIFKISMQASEYWVDPSRLAIRMAVLFMFFFLSGISCSFSRSGVKRLLKLVFVALLFTVVTYSADEIADLGVAIPFGIPHILAVSLLIYVILSKLWDNKYFIFAIGVAILIGGILIDFADTPILRTFDLSNFYEVIIGKASYGVDSYGILPYTGVFLVGAFAGKTVYFDRHTLFPALDKPFIKPLCFIGRNTLIIYVMHQVVIAASVVLIAMSYGFEFFN